MTYFGKGIYTLTTAARILEIKPQRMCRWIKGYTYPKNMECRSVKPLFRTDFEYNPDDVIISFLDLAELLFIKTFIQHGISVQEINNNAEKWWPLGKKKNIVLDPSRNMGQPILNKYNVRTELIFELYKTNHSVDEISEWYELDRKSIEAAISFEDDLAA